MFGQRGQQNGKKIQPAKFKIFLGTGLYASLYFLLSDASRSRQLSESKMVSYCSPLPVNITLRG